MEWKVCSLSTEVFWLWPFWATKCACGNSLIKGGIFKCVFMMPYYEPCGRTFINHRHGRYCVCTVLFNLQKHRMSILQYQYRSRDAKHFISFATISKKENYRAGIWTSALKFSYFKCKIRGKFSLEVKEKEIHVWLKIPTSRSISAYKSLKKPPSHAYRDKYSKQFCVYILAYFKYVSNRKNTFFRQTCYECPIYEINERGLC